MAVQPAGFSPSDYADVVLEVNAAYPLVGVGGEGEAFSYLMRKDAPRDMTILNKITGSDSIKVQGGDTCKFDVVYKESGTASFVLYDQTYSPSIVNVLKQGNVPWRLANVNWTVSEHEIDVCRGPQLVHKLAGFLKPRRAASQMDMALLILDDFWATPDGTSMTRPLDVAHWMVPINTVQVAATGTLGVDVAGAFQGGLPLVSSDGTEATGSLGFTDVAGIDPGTFVVTSGWNDDTYARFRNWNAQWPDSGGEYTDTAEERISKAWRHLQFVSPPTVLDYNTPPFNNITINSNETTIQSMERRLRQQNDQVGFTLARFAGKATVLSIPVTWEPALDTYDSARGYYPTYLINWAHFHFAVREGKVFKEQSFPSNAFQPNLVTTHTFLEYQTIVGDRQKVGAVLSYVA
jgi:hypothetical protein